MAVCNARRKQCDCGHRFTKAEHGLWNCPECGADRHCKQPVRKEGQKCRFHGGASPAGIASPHYRTGRYSKVLPAALAQRYEAALGDGELLALRDEIALLDGRLADLLGTLDTQSSREAWHSLADTFGQLKGAITERDMAAATVAIRQLDEVIVGGNRQVSVWDEVYVLLETRRKLVESERKRLVQMHQVITTEEALVLLARIQESIVRNVTDRSVLKAIATDLNELVDHRAR